MGSNVKRTSAVATVAPDELAGFAGAAQGTDIDLYGDDQGSAPPDPDIAAGPSDLLETVESTLSVFNRSGAILGSIDLNVFMNIPSGYTSSGPRVIYDAGSQRFWLTVGEVPISLSCSATAEPVLVAVSASSNPFPFTGWTIYTLPFATTGALLGDEPGLGVSSNTVAVAFDDINCNAQFIGSEVDILQKTDYEHGSGSRSDAVFTDSAFAPQPVQSFGATQTQYVVTNESDRGVRVCASPTVEVDAYTGTPEGAGGVTATASLLAMTPTSVDNSTGELPPAQELGTSITLQTDDDRFLNAVWENGSIWTAGGTSCTPSGDSAPRSCLDYVYVAASSDGVVESTITQISNVGISGADLYYPAVSVDASGDMFTVFDESSSTTFPSIVDAAVPVGGSALSVFRTIHSSATYYSPPSACEVGSPTVCRWGDYSGAAQDPSNPNDVWAVSEAEDETSAPGACGTQNSCWNTDISLLTLAMPSISSLTPASGPIAGGQTVSVAGLYFGVDTAATFDGASIGISSLTPQSFTFVTPPSAPAGGAVQLQATDVLGASIESAASEYTYVGLANYAPVTPFRLLDTRTDGGPLGAGAIRSQQVTGVGGSPIPSDATAAVLNVTEVSGSASSLLTIYPFGTTRPNASNLNFMAHTVIANLVTVSLGAHGGEGWVSIYNALGSVNVVVDVEGYFTPEAASDYQGLFHPITPIRVCDTRTACEGNRGVGSDASIVVAVATTGGIPSDGTAEAAVVNLTGVAGNASTYLSLFPTDANGHCNPTGTSTINLLPGTVVANRVMVKLGPLSFGGPSDALCIYNAAGSINVLVDADGWYGSATATARPPGYQYQAIAPTRICDTRTASTSCSTGAVGAGTSLQRLITVAGHDAVPAFGGSTTVVAIIANLTAVAPTEATYLTLYPAYLSSPPRVSDINLNVGAVVPNLVVVEIDTEPADAHDGDTYLFNAAGSVNAIIDLEGWFQ